MQKGIGKKKVPARINPLNDSLVFLLLVSSAMSSRILSTLLNEMDGVSSPSSFESSSLQLLVVGATNRPSTLDPALLRPGRFDEILYVWVTNPAPSRLLLFIFPFHFFRFVFPFVFYPFCSLLILSYSAHQN